MPKLFSHTDLIGKKIVDVRYMDDEEMKLSGWSRKAIIFQLDDGSIFFPSADDEGNNAGAIFVQTAHGTPETIGVQY